MQFERFIMVLAGRIGQIVNMEEIGSEIGVSAHTVKSWVSILEASYIVSRLFPYFENFGKRVIKSPKIYFNDTGLACYLLGIQNETQLSRDPLRGNLFENAIYLELKKHQLNLGLDSNLYFYRDQQRNDVDFVFKRGSELIPIEVKSAKTFHSGFVKNIEFFKALVKERSPQGFVVYGGEIEQRFKGDFLLSYKNTVDLFQNSL